MRWRQTVVWVGLGIGCEGVSTDKQGGTGGSEAVDTAGPPDQLPGTDSGPDSADTAPPMDTAEDTGDPVEPVPIDILQAAWGGQVKDFTDPTAGAYCADGAWNSDPAENTRQALLDGGLDTWVANVGVGTVTDCWWLNLERVLGAISEEDGITVAAGVDPGLDFEALAGVVVELRLLAAEEPEVKALVLDDFMGSVRRWDKPGAAFGPDEFAALAALATDTACAAAYCTAPGIELWPHTTAKDVAFVAVPGAELGLAECGAGCASSVDHRLYPADDDHFADAFGAAWTYTPAGGAEDASLRFLFNDRLGGRGLPIADLVVRQDGVELGRYALNDDQDPGTAGQPSGIRSVEVPVQLGAGVATELELVVEARTEVVPETVHRLVRAWGLELWMEDAAEPIELLSVATSVPVARRDGARPGLAVDAAEVAFLELTEPGLIADDADAVLVHDIEPSAIWFDLDVHRHLVGAACRRLRSRGVACHSTQWGNDQWRVDLDAATQAERVRIAREVADGVVIYRHPIDLIGGTRDSDGTFVPPDRGIYREVAPRDSARFDVGATWPRYTRGVPGFRRRFEQAVSCAGEWTVEWAKNGGPGRFELHIAARGATGEVSAHRSDLAEAPTSGNTTLTLAAGDVAVVELVGTASVGNASYGIDARLVAPEACGGQPATAWTTSSHVDPELAEQFECVHAALLELEVPGCEVG